MNVKKIKRLVFVLMVVLSLLFTTVASASTGGGDDGETPNDYIDQASTTTSDAFPTRGTSEPGIQPDAVKAMPGGGYATARAILSWVVLVYMQGIAETSLSSDVTGTYILCAKAVEVYRDGVPMGGAGQVCANRTGGGRVRSTKTVYGNPVGHTWRLNTYHQVPAIGWYPSLTVNATP